MKSAVEWVREHRRLPTEYKKPQTREEFTERAAALGIRRLRQKPYDALPVSTKKLLNEACPGWRFARPNRKTAEQALAEAEELTAWCLQHHGGKPVGKNFNPRICNDKESHQRMWGLLRYLKEAKADPTYGAEAYTEAFKVLDDAFGAENWQQKKRKFEGTEYRVYVVRKRSRSERYRDEEGGTSEGTSGMDADEEQETQGGYGAEEEEEIDEGDEGGRPASVRAPSPPSLPSLVKTAKEEIDEGDEGGRSASVQVPSPAPRPSSSTMAKEEKIDEDDERGPPVSEQVEEPEQEEELPPGDHEPAQLEDGDVLEGVRGLLQLAALRN